MTLDEMRGYWSRGAAHAPTTTGAAGLMDCRDLIEVFATLGVAVPVQSIFDVGCGTGRARLLADPRSDWSYLGVDVSPSQIEYARQQKRMVALIDGPEDIADLDTGAFEWTLMISLLTHLPPDLAEAYLRTVKSPFLLFDIFPGDGSGSFPVWTQSHAHVARVLDEQGYAIRRIVEKPWDHQPGQTDIHTFIHAERVA